MMNEPISTIMTRDLITISPDLKVSKAFEMLMQHRIHHLPVVKNGDELVGLVTTYDLFKLNLPENAYKRIQIDSIMTTKLATLTPSDKVGTAAEIFLEHLFHALPIVEEGKLVGIVTTFDVLKYNFRKEYPRKMARRDRREQIRKDRRELAE